MPTRQIDVTDSELLAVPGGPYAVLQRIRWEVAPELAPPQDPWGEETLLSSLYNPALVTTW